jgi:hypothetical protein
MGAAFRLLAFQRAAPSEPLLSYSQAAGYNGDSEQLMKFVPGSPLSDAKLSEISHSLVDAHGENARDIVNNMIDQAFLKGDAVEHSTWVNVALGVLQILRPAL